ncbi:MAG: hypothetical protein UY72_C0069G0009 [Candidatus Uhrbacteria bacterium GW2011_GWD2_52_7]|uniref:SbsA Ig-like domain-containing protein n=1 Tax=Candidatus Uhrbacteria bacterium GW2011_GWD2_52_7 TaxID=1618989 RepID=A0A0G1XCC1_9BACT|nr:MAG: hypothetical protein UY72_C0069G0009 [Candidatus Uhrbacteria bacterium GW2011_GWD2_52_7]
MQQFSLTQRTSTMISAAVAAVVVSVGFLLSASHAYAVAPTMLSGATNTFVEDATGDGTVDKITITFSAAVNINDSALDGFPNLALSNSCTIPTGDYSSASTTTLVITGLTGCTAGNTALTPTVTYTALGNCVGDGTICDQATDLDEMANGANVTSSDKAKPAILTATTGDNNSDGTVDRLVLTFSESVNITTGGADNDFTLVASSGTATLVAAGYASPDTTMTYTITASATGNTSLTVAPTYVVAGAGSIIDVNSNEMNNGETVAGTDGAKPAVLTAATRDNTADGSIDQLVLTFSESVVITDGGTDNDFTLVASSGTATITAAAYGATASTLTYTITTSVTGDTSLTVTPTYATAGAGSITDASLTEMNNGETVAGTDGAKPVFMSASPASGTAASRSSSLTMTMSETVASATATTNSGVTLTCTISTVTITCVPNHAFRALLEASRVTP